MLNFEQNIEQDRALGFARGAVLLDGCCETIKGGLNTSHFEVPQALTFVTCYGILISVPIQKEQTREAKKPWHRAKALHW